MILYELLENINDNCNIEIYSAETNCEIARYDGKESIPEEYDDCEVTDIFINADGSGLSNYAAICIEIEQ